MRLPTRSLALLPIRLLAGDIAPVTPAVPLPQVAAPRLPFQCGLATTKLPLLRAVMPPPVPPPTWSPAELPSSELRSAPVSPSYTYAAPALVPPKLSLGL